MFIYFAFVDISTILLNQMEEYPFSELHFDPFRKHTQFDSQVEQH